MARKKTQVSKKIKRYIQDYLEALKKDKLPIEKVILYGSHAKREAGKWSDLDLCIISKRFKNSSEALRYLWHKRRPQDIIRGIEPVGYHPKDFVDESPLVWEIKKTGIEIK